MYKPGKYAFQFANWTKEKFLQNDRKNLYSMTDRYSAIEKIRFLQTLKKNPCKRTKGYLWLNTNDSCEWNARALENVCRKDTCSWAENIPAVGLKGFLQRCREGTCFCRKNMCSWTEGVPARGRVPAWVQMRISANVQKGFLWKNWRYTCKLAERISVVVHVYIHYRYISGGTKDIPANWLKGFSYKKNIWGRTIFICLDYYCLKLVMTRNKPFFQMIIHQVHVFVISQ